MMVTLGHFALVAIGWLAHVAWILLRTPPQPERLELPSARAPIRGELPAATARAIRNARRAQRMPFIPPRHRIVPANHDFDTEETR